MIGTKDLIRCKHNVEEPASFSEHCIKYLPTKIRLFQHCVRPRLAKNCLNPFTCSYPRIKFDYGHDTSYGHEMSVLEMDGQFDRLDELIYVESHLGNISTKFYGEVTQQMMKHSDFRGSNNVTCLFQTIIGLKICDLYEQITASKMQAPGEDSKA